MLSSSIPSHIRQVIGDEIVLFETKNTWFYPRKKNYVILGFCLFWNLFVSIFVIAFFGPIFKGEDVTLTTDTGKIITGGFDNWEPILVPALLIGIFVIVGIYLIGYTVYRFLKRGGNFIATDSSLIYYKNSKLEIYPWEAFTGTMKVDFGKSNGSVLLDLKTGKTKQVNKKTTIQPDQLYLSDLTDAIKVQNICNKQINQTKAVRKV